MPRAARRASTASGEDRRRAARRASTCELGQELPRTVPCSRPVAAARVLPPPYVGLGAVLAPCSAAAGLRAGLRAAPSRAVGEAVSWTADASVKSCASSAARGQNMTCTPDPTRGKSGTWPYFGARILWSRASVRSVRCCAATPR